MSPLIGCMPGRPDGNPLPTTPALPFERLTSILLLRFRIKQRRSSKTVRLHGVSFLQSHPNMAAQAKNQTEIEKAKKLNHVPWCEEYEKMISGML
ncbi:hypothetical protein BDV96DRAFT_570256 [Lophiotrema nucula]|uniref:Uncharacterized protein n=1 Tax=Lophiotrema nucula TaxID=690887 RepID=A0A6A5ZHQ1_9PLEO|nr:hypothetical protein BDV96DRAFT_570256 [Lophiotrema nucula]